MSVSGVFGGLKASASTQEKFERATLCTFSQKEGVWNFGCAYAISERPVEIACDAADDPPPAANCAKSCCSVEYACCAAVRLPDCSACPSCENIWLMVVLALAPPLCA